MPHFPIFDSHVHLYDPQAIRFDWMKDVPLLNKPHGPADYDRLTAPVEVEGLVFVEVDAAPGENMKEARWVSALMAREPRVKAIVASLPLERGPDAVAHDMAELARLPGVKGIRRLIQGHVDEPAWCLRQPFVEAVQSLAAYNLSFDICIKHPQMRDAIELVARCPKVNFILDHIGKPGIAAKLQDPWRIEIRELASHKNIVCKISGVVTEADHATWSEAEVTPYIEHAIEAFGLGRVMFGGDWPVSELATRYPRWVALLDKILQHATDAERRHFYRGAAAQAYRF